MEGEEVVSIRLRVCMREWGRVSGCFSYCLGGTMSCIATGLHYLFPPGVVFLYSPLESGVWGMCV